MTFATLTLIYLCERCCATRSGRALLPDFRFVARRFRLNAHTYRLLIFKELAVLRSAQKRNDDTPFCICQAAAAFTECLA